VRNENAAQVLTERLLDKISGHLLRQSEERNVNTDADAKVRLDLDGEERGKDHPALLGGS
jgi:hypothetical protein